MQQKRFHYQCPIEGIGLRLTVRTKTISTSTDSGVRLVEKTKDPTAANCQVFLKCSSALSLVGDLRNHVKSFVDLITVKMIAQSIFKAQVEPLLFNYNPSIPQSTVKAALYLKPTDSSHHGRAGYYFQVFCSYNNRQFGGLYSKAEAQRILGDFRGRCRQVAPREFGASAERAIAATYQRGAA